MEVQGCLSGERHALGSSLGVGGAGQEVDRVVQCPGPVVLPSPLKYSSFLFPFLPLLSPSLPPLPSPSPPLPFYFSFYSESVR